MTCGIYPLDALEGLRYVVVVSYLKGHVLLSRHRQRDGWETQGGHIEPGETPEQAARRELYEESGARVFTLAPLCDYRAQDDLSGANGRVYIAFIDELDPLPESEMAETRLFDVLPERLTYPAITPVLFAEAERRLRTGDFIDKTQRIDV